MFSAGQVVDHVARRLPAFSARGDPIPLLGGTTNQVWRLEGEPRSIVIKHAPERVAARPERAMDPRRVLFEARSLRSLIRGGELAGVASVTVRAPMLFDVDLRSHTLIMEDVGPLIDLGAHLAEGRGAMQIGDLVGRFIGRLHAKSLHNSVLARRFDNVGAQKLRRQTEYLMIGDFCRRAHLADSGEIGRIAAGLGDRLMKKGICVIMGDLSPPSILILGDAVRVIDWELAHFGNPAQDLAQMAAHLWMHAQRAADTTAQLHAQVALQSFFEAYQKAIGEHRSELLSREVLEDCAVHFGCELLWSTIGTRQAGYLYDGLPPDSPSVEEAVGLAVDHIRAPAEGWVFDPLRAQNGGSRS